MKSINLGDQRNLENNPELKDRFNDFMYQKHDELKNGAADYFNTNPEFRGLLKTIRKGQLHVKKVLNFFDEKDQEISVGSKVKLNF
jgi:hypothetical protein